MAVDPSTNAQPMDPTTKLIGDLTGDYSTQADLDKLAKRDKPLGYAAMQHGRAELSAFAQSNGKDLSLLHPAAANPAATLPQGRKPPVSRMRAEQSDQPAMKHHAKQHHTKYHHATAGAQTQQRQPQKQPMLPKFGA